MVTAVFLLLQETFAVGGGDDNATSKQEFRWRVCFLLAFFWWCCGGCRRLLSLLGWLAGEDMTADGPRVRSVFLSLFANGVEIWLSPLVGFASGLHALWPASADPLSGLLVMISIAINCGFVLPSSRARDGRCDFRGIRCITAGVRLRLILRLVQGGKSLFQLEEHLALLVPALLVGVGHLRGRQS